MQILLGPALTNQIQFLFIDIKNEKDRFAHMKRLFKHAKALTVYESTYFRFYILYLSVKTKPR